MLVTVKSALWNGPSVQHWKNPKPRATPLGRLNRVVKSFKLKSSLIFDYPKLGFLTVKQNCLLTWWGWDWTGGASTVQALCKQLSLLPMEKCRFRVHTEVRIRNWRLRSVFKAFSSKFKIGHSKIYHHDAAYQNAATPRKESPSNRPYSPGWNRLF